MLEINKKLINFLKEKIGKLTIQKINEKYNSLEIIYNLLRVYNKVSPLICLCLIT